MGPSSPGVTTTRAATAARSRTARSQRCRFLSGLFCVFFVQLSLSLVGKVESRFDMVSRSKRQWDPIPDQIKESRLGGSFGYLDRTQEGLHWKALSRPKSLLRSSCGTCKSSRQHPGRLQHCAWSVRLCCKVLVCSSLRLQIVQSRGYNMFRASTYVVFIDLEP